MLTCFFPTCAKPRRITGTDDTETAIKRLAEMVPLVVVKLGHRGRAGATRQGAVHQPRPERHGRRCSRRRRQLRRRLSARVSARLRSHQPAWPAATAPARFRSRGREEPKPSATKNIASAFCASTHFSLDVRCGGRPRPPPLGLILMFLEPQPEDQRQRQRCRGRPPHTILLLHFQQQMILELGLKPGSRARRNFHRSQIFALIIVRHLIAARLQPTQLNLSLPRC